MPPKSKVKKGPARAPVAKTRKAASASRAQASKGSVVVGGNVTQGSIRIHNDHRKFGGDAGRSSGQGPTVTWKSLVTAATPYLRRVQRESRQLPLGSLTGDRDTSREQEDQMGLDAVYIHLATDLRRKATAEEKKKAGMEFSRRPGPEGEGDTVPMTALEVLRENPVCVVLGDPGSGKSALLNYLTWNLATFALAGGKSVPSALAGWTSGQAQAVPVVWVLRRFVKWVQDSLPGVADRALPEPSVEHLWRFLEEKELRSDERAMVPFLRQAIEKGWVACFLDGIDEVPDETLARFVQGCALELRTKHPQARVVGTCRTVPYRDRGGERGWTGVPAATLQPLDDGRIRTFVEGWFRAERERCAMPAEQADSKSGKLLGAILDPHRAELRELAGNPMLLTVMALLQTGQQELPENRAQLYKDVTQLLLHRWDARRSDDGQMTAGVTQVLRERGLDQNILERVLWRIGWKAQCGARSGKGAKQGLGDIPRHVLQEEFVATLRRPQPEDQGWAARLIQAISTRAGLLVAVDENLFQFPHRSFQEFLAAGYLLDRSKPEPVANRQDGDDVDNRVRHYPEGIGALFDETMYWREVLRWTVGIATHVKNEPLLGLSIIEALCPANVLEGEHGWLRVWVAGEALHELRVDTARDYPSKSAVVERVRTKLARLIEDPAQPLETRRRHLAGIALGHVGDPRPGVAPPWPPTKEEPFFRWSKRIEPDPGFLIGGDPHAWNSPKEPVPWPIKQPFHLTAYPVTNAQYDAFEASEMFRSARWDRRDRSEPRLCVPNHPVVNVNWGEAMRFCRWLDDLLQKGSLTLSQLGVQGGVPGDVWRICLPTEAQWELAARGSERRCLPWLPQVADIEGALAVMPELLKSRCNWHGEGLDGTSAVGLFSGAASPDGCYDLIGNVWEWTRSRARWSGRRLLVEGDSVSVRLNDTELRVLRGGSWVEETASLIRSTWRYAGDPWFSFMFIGFRVDCVRVSESGG